MIQPQLGWATKSNIKVHYKTKCVGDVKLKEHIWKEHCNIVIHSPDLNLTCARFLVTLEEKQLL